MLKKWTSVNFAARAKRGPQSHEFKFIQECSKKYFPSTKVLKEQVKTPTKAGDMGDTEIDKCAK